MFRHHPWKTQVCFLNHSSRRDWIFFWGGYVFGVLTEFSLTRSWLGGGFKYFLFSSRSLGKFYTFTSICFKWVGSTTNYSWLAIYIEVYKWYFSCQLGGYIYITYHPITGSTIITLLHGKINPKDWQVLSLGDVGFLLFFRVVSGDYGKPWLREPGNSWVEIFLPSPWGKPPRESRAYLQLQRLLDRKRRSSEVVWKGGKTTGIFLRFPGEGV